MMIFKIFLARYFKEHSLSKQSAPASFASPNLKTKMIPYRAFI